jgi:hypothetical protein
MVRITILLEKTATQLSFQCGLAEAGEALTTLRAILPGLRIAGAFSSGECESGGPSSRPGNAGGLRDG